MTLTFKVVQVKVKGHQIMQGPVQVDFSGTKEDNEVKLSLKGRSSFYLLLEHKPDDLDLHDLSGQGRRSALNAMVFGG